MAKTKLVADWKEIDPATLNKALSTAYTAYKDKYREAKVLRDAFEALATKTANLPEGYRMVFGYNFGKLSGAVVPAKDASVSKKAIDFAALKAA